MDLKTAKKVTDLLVSCVLADLVLMLFLPHGGKVVLTWVLIGLLITVGAVHLLWMRCPHCGKFLPKSDGDLAFCPHCGKPLPSDDVE